MKAVLLVEAVILLIVMAAGIAQGSALATIIAGVGAWIVLFMLALDPPRWLLGRWR